MCNLTQIVETNTTARRNNLEQPDCGGLTESRALEG
jgi:hypothetical protein